MFEKLVDRYEDDRSQTKLKGNEYRDSEEFEKWQKDVEKAIPSSDGKKRVKDTFVKRMIGEMYSWILNKVRRTQPLIATYRPRLPLCSMM